MFNELKSILESLNYDPANLSHSSTGDGRLDSAESEEGIIKFLMDKLSSPDFHIESAPARFWYDVKMCYKGEYFPINIKITAGKGADNVSSKEGMFYALTGINPTEVVGLNKWEGYIQSIQMQYYHNLFNKQYILHKKVCILCSTR